MTQKTDYENICMHLGEEDISNARPVSPPIYQTSLFTFESYDDVCHAIDAPYEEKPCFYTRGENPTIDLLCKKLAALEGAESAYVFSSGMGAISSAILAYAKKGGHILLVNNVYPHTTAFVAYLGELGIEYDNIFIEDVAKIEEYIRPNTSLIWFESPGTMMFKVIDVEHIVSVAKKHNIVTGMDNTWATPIFFNPLKLGVDVVAHSVTKYLNGHSDVVAGAVCGSKEVVYRIKEEISIHNGTTMAPFNAWLILRGLRTLKLRMDKHNENTMAVLDFLSTRQEVEVINHPLCLGKEQKQIFEKYFSGTSGLFSIELKQASFEKIRLFIDSLKLFTKGCSWGGYESLVIALNRKHNEEQMVKDGLSPGIIRFAIGLEQKEDIIYDLKTALNQFSK